MGQREGSTFGLVLQRYRVAAELTQEQLAERAGLSVRGISDLERGVRIRPRAFTVEQLADALELSPDDRAVLVRAARGGRAQEAPKGLLASLTPFVGREHEVEQIYWLVRRHDLRLLTLTGPGGTGKTRLALRAADELSGEFADGTYVTSLASIIDPSLVLPTVAASLGLKGNGKESREEALEAWLRPRKVLLVLDNLEHLPAAGPTIAQLLTACPRVKVIATSRAPLHISGEQQMHVPPLALPHPGDVPPMDELLRYDAVALFLQRAQAVAPELALTATNAATIVELCRRLEGLPLSLELAAARLRILTPDALFQRLTSRLHLLRSRDIDIPERHQTLRATLEWSYSLLGEPERRLFAHIAVFRGGFTLEAAEAVAGRGDSADVLDGIESLVDSSLLGQDPGHRLRMLETVREYAQERLECSGEEGDLRRRHTDYYLGFAETAALEVMRGNQQIWLDQLDAEHDNLRAVLQWALDRTELELGLRVSIALWRFWEVRGHVQEGRRWLEALLGRTNTVAPAVRGRALSVLGSLSRDQGDYDRARAVLEEATALHRQINDRPGLAAALTNLGLTLLEQGDSDGATVTFEESLAIRRELGDRGGMAVSLHNLGLIAQYQGRILKAAAYYDESLPLAREVGDRRNVAITVNNRAGIARDSGDLVRAAELWNESLTLSRELDAKPVIALSLGGLAELAHLQGDPERAMQLWEERLHICRKLGDKRGCAYTLAGHGWAMAAYDQEDLVRAEALLGEALVLHRKIGNDMGVGRVLIPLATVALDRADLDRAAELFEEAHRLAQSTGDGREAALAQLGLGSVAQARGELDRAEDLYLKSLRSCYQGGRLADAPAVLEAKATVRLMRRDHTAGLRLFAAAQAARQRMGAPLSPRRAREREQTLASARAEIDDATWNAAWKEGSTTSLDNAIVYALGPAVDPSR